LLLLPEVIDLFLGGLPARYERAHRGDEAAAEARAFDLVEAAQGFHPADGLFERAVGRTVVVTFGEGVRGAGAFEEVVGLVPAPRAAAAGERPLRERDGLAQGLAGRFLGGLRERAGFGVGH